MCTTPNDNGGYPHRSCQLLGKAFTMFHAAPQLTLVPWNYWWVDDGGSYDFDGDDDDGDDGVVDGNDDGDEYNRHYPCSSHASWSFRTIGDLMEMIILVIVMMIINICFPSNQFNLEGVWTSWEWRSITILVPWICFWCSSWWEGWWWISVSIKSMKLERCLDLLRMTIHQSRCIILR